MAIDVDISVVTSDTFKDKVSQRDSLNVKMAELAKSHKNLAFEIIRDCNHPFIAVSNSSGRFPYSRDETAVCRACGLALSGQSGFAPSVPFINFQKSLIVFEQNDRPFRDAIEVKLSAEAQYAMQYPKRFTPEYLQELLTNTPFNSDDVLSADNRNYTVYSNEIIGNHEIYRNLCCSD